MTELAGARVLVTGASGMIGRAVLDVLGTDTDVHAVSRQPQPSRPGVTWWQVDLAEPGAQGNVVEAARRKLLFVLKMLTHGLEGAEGLVNRTIQQA